MRLHVTVDDLMDYTDWERQDWHALLGQQGAGVLKTSTGPHGDGRFEAVGELIRHIFSAEKRYVERLSGQSLTDTASIPIDNVDALFGFGQQSRNDLRRFVEVFPAEQWDLPQDFTLMQSSLRATPRKIVVHVLMHEIRHWAQIATLLRLNGAKSGFHDFLFSPVLGGEFRSGIR
jgi:uncharacterized damage-inducible protein DinB